MHIDTEFATSAVAITVGMSIRDHDPVFDWASSNGWGGIELYHEIGQLAAFSCDLANKVATCPDFLVTGFPGVYAYEVEEPLGAWLAAAMRNGRLPTGPETPAHLLDYAPVKRELGRLAYEFFRKAPHPIPYTDGIIFELTGYDHGEHVIAVQVVPVVEDSDHNVTAQFAGPDEKTTGWAIYDRLADGTARWFSDRYTEERAMAAGFNRAAGLGVAIEPQPWRVAK